MFQCNKINRVLCMDFVQATGIHVIFQFAKCLIDARLIIALNVGMLPEGRDLKLCPLFETLLPDFLVA